MEASPIPRNTQEDRPVFESLKIALISSSKGNRRVH
jgi:hypothetical protein